MLAGNEYENASVYGEKVFTIDINLTDAGGKRCILI
jgi:hypothetical protein